jgi:hypothetical protein
VDAPEPQDAGSEKPDGDAALARAMVDTHCSITKAFLDARKACDVDADCAMVSYHPTCCENVHVVGVNKDKVDEVSTCDMQGPPACRCEDTPPNRTDDGRATLDPMFADVSLACVDHECRSEIAKRSCGKSHVCMPNEVCVTYGLAEGEPQPEPPSPGDNSYLAYVCVPNPCADSELTCTCAQAACDARGGGVTRKCEIELNTDSDVACVPYKD